MLCSGKIYYDVLEKFEVLDTKITDNIALVRIEQLHPFPESAIDKIVKRYGKKAKVVWLQEEPRNMGAWPFISMHYKGELEKAITRPASGTTASGSPLIYARRHDAIIDAVLEYAH